METMPNPIQQVLEAEREAGERIEQAQREADIVVGDARREAKQVLERNERRTQKVLANYERNQKQLAELEATRLRHEAGTNLKQTLSRVDANFEDLVEQTFDEFWPR